MQTYREQETEFLRGKLLVLGAGASYGISASCLQNSLPTDSNCVRSLQYGKVPSLPHMDCSFQFLFLPSFPFVSYFLLFI